MPEIRMLALKKRMLAFHLYISVLLKFHIFTDLFLLMCIVLCMHVYVCVHVYKVCMHEAQG